MKRGKYLKKEEIMKYIKERLKKIPYLFEVRVIDSKEKHRMADARERKIFLDLSRTTEDDVSIACNNYLSDAAKPVHVNDHVLWFYNIGDDLYVFHSFAHPSDEKKCKFKLTEKKIHNIMVAHGLLDDDLIL